MNTPADQSRDAGSEGSGEWREAIARIIDPDAWEARDKEPSIRKHKNPGGLDWERYRELGCRPSLVKADAILALLRALQSKGEAS